MASLKNSASKWALCFECDYIGNKSALHLVILDDLVRFQLMFGVQLHYTKIISFDRHATFYMGPRSINFSVFC